VIGVSTISQEGVLLMGDTGVSIKHRVRQLVAVTLVVTGCTCAATSLFGAQAPALRSSVDLILADVQVVDTDGHPVTGLTADRFEVTIDNKKHRVAIADLVTVSTQKTTAGGPPAAPAAVADPLAVPPVPPAPADRRIFVIAVDSLSFGAAQSAAVMKVAQSFVDRLPAADVVGLFTYPTGPMINPTTDRSAVAQAIGRLRGAREPNPTGRFVLRPSEVVDLMNDPGGRGPTDPAAVEVIRRECGTDQNCQRQLMLEVQTAAQQIEAGAFLSLGGLRTLLQGLGSVQGRKTMVLLTAGMIASDRNGRPDVSELSMLAGQDAARSNVMVYTVFVDTSATTQMSPERRSGAPNRFASSARDSEVLGHWFDQFSGTAGGMLIRDQIGDGEIAFDRILEETSAYYRLGIEPTDAIRDGRPHQIKVTVNGRKATVRGRRWVIVPAK
jgi:VWFA-related protein